MLDIRWIRDHADELDAALKKRGAEPAAEALVALDEKRRAEVQKLQEMQSRRNAASKEIGAAMGRGERDKAEALKAEVASLKDTMQESEEVVRHLEAELDATLSVLPNLPADDVPVGADENDNVVARTVGKKPGWNHAAKEHFDIGEALGGMDFEGAAKLSGARFTVLRGQLARLERALGQFMLDLHTSEHGYQEVSPPLLVRDAPLFGTGQLPKFEEDLFETSRQLTRREIQEAAARKALDFVADRVKTEDVSELLLGHGELPDELQLEFARSSGAERMYLIPTAEVPLTNLVREQILGTDALPMRFAALTYCFRSEAGSAGRDTRGMLRQHQFLKCELVSVTNAESSVDEHERMTACAEEVLKRLGLHYRVVTLCTGDMGFSARKTYDLEVWLPGQDAYREISSCSVCGDFQARRMNARYRVEGEKGTRFVHTLNGSGVAVGRALIAVLENYLNEDGSVSVPDALVPYMGGLTKLELPA